MIEIKIPKLDNNSDIAIISWNVKNKEKVTKGQILADIETSKAVEELKSEKDGYIHILEEYGSEVPFNTTIAYIADTKEELEKINQ